MLAVVHMALVAIVVVVPFLVVRKVNALGYIVYGIIPLILAAFLWPWSTTVEYVSVNSWFHYAKVVSVLIAALGLTIIRQRSLDIYLAGRLFAPVVLGLNILEAVVNEALLAVQTGEISSMVNVATGVMLIMTMTGWNAIRVSAESGQFEWKDLSLSWIVAYTIWNFTYVYTIIPYHAVFAVIVLGASLVSDLVKPGSWAASRAYILGAWMIYLMSAAPFVDRSENLVLLPESAAAQAILAILGLSTIAVHVTRIVRTGTGNTLRAYLSGAPMNAKTNET
jgi:hypothetical protein